MTDQRLIKTVRKFNRSYLGKLGVLNRSVLESDYSLVEGRVLFELSEQKEALASDVAEALSLDEGYLSRVLAGFEKKGLVKRKKSDGDARRRVVTVTAKGKSALQDLNKRADKQIADMFSHLSKPNQAKLMRAVRVFEDALDEIVD